MATGNEGPQEERIEQFDLIGYGSASDVDRPSAEEMTGSSSIGRGHGARSTVQPSGSAVATASTSKVGSSSLASPGQSNGGGNSELARRPVRERLVHLLALRPFKTPELLAKLNKDGLKERDKKGLSLLLNSVASLRENAFHIGRHAWHEVNVDDWPHYTPEERELVRSRRPLLSQPPNAPPLSSDCNVLSPLPSTPSPLSNSSAIQSIVSQTSAISSINQNMQQTNGHHATSASSAIHSIFDSIFDADSDEEY